jgi:hypothetical protein
MLRLPLLVLLFGDSPTTPGTRIQGYPLLPPCGTRDPFGRALGYPMHSGAEAPSGASLGGTVVQGYPFPRDPQGSLGARASHGRALGYPMHPGAGRPQRSTSGMTVVQGYPLPRGSQGCCCSLGGTVVQGDPLPRDPQGAVSSSGGTVVQGDPLPRDPRRSSVELRVLVHSAVPLILCLRFPAIIHSF